MFEARIEEGNVLKKILDAIKDLVSDANFECTQQGLQLQAMDSSHVALVCLDLKAEGFEYFRCDKKRELGISLKNMSQILKCAGNDDQITMKAEDEGDYVEFLCESKSNDRSSNFELKLMDIDSENLGIPDTTYDAIVKMPAVEFQRIVRDLGSVGDTLTIKVTKEAVEFSTKGDIGTGTITVKTTSDAKVDAADGDDDEEGGDDDGDKKGAKTKKEKKKGGAEKKDVKAKTLGDSTASVKDVSITLEKEVALSFGTRYMNFFAKATSLSDYVLLSLSPDLPVVVEYKINSMGNVRFYLAPRIGEDNE